MVVLEVGAGLGSLTGLLARVAHVTTVEIDRHMLEPLAEALKHFPTFKLCRDILELIRYPGEPGKLRGGEHPTTSHHHNHLLETDQKTFAGDPDHSKEVAHRIVARDGKELALAFSVCFCEPEIAALSL